MRDGRDDGTDIRGGTDRDGSSGRLATRRRPPDEPAELAEPRRTAGEAACLRRGRGRPDERAAAATLRVEEALDRAREPGLGQVADDPRPLDQADLAVLL